MQENKIHFDLQFKNKRKNHNDNRYLIALADEIILALSLIKFSQIGKILNHQLCITSYPVL